MHAKHHNAAYRAVNAVVLLTLTAAVFVKRRVAAMDVQQALAIMEVMAKKIEELTERVASAERRLDEARQCSCQTWREHTGLPRHDGDGPTGDIG